MVKSGQEKSETEKKRRFELKKLKFRKVKTWVLLVLLVPLLFRDANQALEEAESQLADDANPNGNIYQAASNVCSPQAIANGWDWNTPDYINCMMGEINKYPAAEDLNDQVLASLPSTELYRMNFASPVWAPTLTGFCILITLLLIVVIIIRAIIWLVLRLSLLFV